MGQQEVSGNKQELDDQMVAGSLSLVATEYSASETTATKVKNLF